MEKETKKIEKINLDDKERLSIIKHNDEKRRQELRKQTWSSNNKDIFVSKKEEVKEYNKDGSITIKYKTTDINLTKRINATAQLLKAQTAEQKLEQLKKII